MYLKIVFIFLSLLTVLSAEEIKGAHKIAAILPLSGSVASLGNYLKNGIELAYKNLAPDLRQQIEIVYEDDQLQAAKSVAAFQKLSTQSDIDLVLVLGSGIGNAVAPLAEKAEIPLIAIGASDSAIVKNRKFSFIHWVSPEKEARVLVDEIVRKNYDEIAIVGTEQEGSIALVNAIKPELLARDLQSKVVFENAFLPDNSDFKTAISKLKSLKVDVVITILFPGPLATFAKQARDLKLGADLAGIELFEDENEVKASEGALVGQWYVNAELPEGSFVNLYQNQYGSHPGWAAANAFDCINLYAKALNSNSGEGEKLIAFLEGLKNYKGAAGVYSSTGDHRFDLPATVKIVLEDGFGKL